MATPSIQTLITQAQQVLNLQSSNEIRATLAAVLANANVGTPLNPNLTTQQLWNEFGEIVRQSTDDIMSIITDQMMRMVFSPPAPGGAGADKQVIFNDGGVLSGDTKFLWDKNANRLDVDGPVVITGDLTVDTSTLKVDSTNNRVGIGTATMAEKLTIDNNLGGSAAGLRVYANDQSTARIAVQNTNGQAWHLVAGYAGANNQGLSIFDSTTNANRLYLDTSGNANIINGNLILGTSGKGIDFSATAGTGTSELLNDYEEGTFTATVRGTVSDPTVPLTATCRYTKVGRQVFVEGVIDGNTTGASGQVFISSLPFASAAGSIERPGSVQLNNMATFTGYATAYIAASQLNINFYSSASGGALGNVIHNPGAGRTIWFGITYTV